MEGIYRFCFPGYELLEADGKVVFEIQESLNNMREHARSIEVGVSEIIQVWIVELLTMKSWNICLT
jgi:hypothetical protein